MFTRAQTRRIRVGKVPIGGGAPVAIQSMTITETRDVEATVQQIRDLHVAGADIVRVAVPRDEDALALPAICRDAPCPVIADIHFDFRLAMLALEADLGGLRLNPGNIGGEERVKKVAHKARDKGIPIRIGVNAGSLEKGLREVLHGDVPQAMVVSASRHIGMLEAVDFHDIKVSLKSSDVRTTIEAYRVFAERYDYPLHLGVTEAGTLVQGAVRSAAGIGTLLADGLGDTIRVSLATDPVQEVAVAKHLLKAFGLRAGGMTLVACPSCGRAQVDVFAMAERVEKRLRAVKADITVAVMGCAVNGPGEARDADVGLAGGNDAFLLFRKGEIVKKFPPADAEDRLVEEALRIAAEMGRLPT
ncbi:MAG TPA: flavodoxin-dependent (E)-4-hydroxy-3-methylbut-2-enyl-diphosphate synthase [Myxococcota bacterium]|nr:flavodoxin-dependent (E)-4-hydroxy-3-methylbut-2-enyl-diphosphate synthase [Myxococcota bacterium]